VHQLPRQLKVDELAELFEGHTRLTEELARREDPLGQARAVLEELPEEARIEALNTHPRIGESSGSARSASEQGSDDDPALLAALQHLNKAYEEKFGFRFVVFVNRRPRAEVLSVLRERLQHSREEELGTGLDELVAIALDRWQSR
jgi:2-oxo-4-hydroxy-4-carboxy--5-ureidoimidazoline (OHCU) decarboxylase